MFGRKKISLEDQTDEKLYALMTSGNANAFNLLYKRYQGKLLYYFFRMLGNNKSLAEDFLQELFYKIIDKPHLFDTKRKFSTWVYCVAHNMCKNEYRGQAVRQIILKGQNTDHYSETSVNYDEKEMLVESIFKELEQFDETHRTAFLLKYREGMGIEDIAEILELPAGTVKSRLFYTRKKLQESLSGVYAEMIEELY
jgi:RNA polymerase sigma-70 factor (ECF subfamily)